MRRSTITAATSIFVAVLLWAAAFAGPAASGATRSLAAIPAGFHAQSTSWVSSQQGWLLGVASCGTSTCTTVDGTTNGGGSWSTLGTLGAPIANDDPSGVTEIRFADALHGYAFLPSLWATVDGGATWTSQTLPGGSNRVLALAGDADAVYAVMSPCIVNQSCTHQATLWKTTAGGTSWIRVRSVTLPVAVTATLTMSGVTAYVLAPPEMPNAVLDVTTDGQTWSSRPIPCDASIQETLWDVAAYSATDVAFVCISNAGIGLSDKRVFRSIDTGQTTTAAGRPPKGGNQTMLAAAPNGTLLVAASSGASFIYRNGGTTRWTTPLTLSDGGQGWNDIQFVTKKLAFVVHGPVSCCGGFGPGELYESQDGGLTWASV